MKKIEINNELYCKKNNKISFNFMPGGILKNITSGNIMINLFITPKLESAISNIYLRELKNDKVVEVTKLLFTSESVIYNTAEGNFIWETKKDKFLAKVILSFGEKNDSVFYYTVQVENNSIDNFTFDVIYGQDLSLSDINATKTNESYVSQYLDYKIFNLDRYGYTISARQNLPQTTGNPLVQLGSFSNIDGYSTDGYQFFDKQYKFTDEPAIYKVKNLKNENYQYEMAYVALQSESITLTKNEISNQVFYCYYLDNQLDANLNKAIDPNELKQFYHLPKLDSAIQIEDDNNFKLSSTTISGNILSNDKLNNFFGDKKLFAEYKDNTLLSFFTEQGNYITLPEKEIYQERSTGHIITAGNNLDFKNTLMNSTHFIYGIFNSHLTLGNTSFNKLLGSNRNLLNFFKTTGQRIYVKINNEYRLLAMPSAYETGINFSRWIYQLDEGTIQIYSFASKDNAAVQLEIKLNKFEKPLELMITNQLIMGNNEEESIVNVTKSDTNNCLFISSEDMPSLKFELVYSDEFKQVETLVNKQGSADYLLLKGTVSDRAMIIISEKDKKLTSLSQWLNLDNEIKNYEDKFELFLNNLDINFEQKPELSKKLNYSLRWFAHNALVHYSSPHGLEQASGAAWGTRDVSQGPFEFFMALGEYSIVENILSEIYQHQYLETGTWPQWFMFDDYSQIQQEECHGDIVVWPLKALADYILSTGTTDILSKKVPYTSLKNKHHFTEEKETILQHVKKQIDYIVKNFIPNTYLSSYGDGDWDDTLQPANQSLRENMVSGWTIPLTLQTFKSLSKALSNENEFTDLVKYIDDLTLKIEADYNKYLIKDGIISGFIHFDNDNVNYLLHPNDNKTNIKFRLLPAKRSIISESFDKKTAERHMDIILNELMYPDGVRLMDKMAQYASGQQTYFKRAELSANLGREIGLQYCHAHIRLIEALCKMGKAKEIYDNLFKILPVDIQKSVPNAELRQANSYFSSSDAKFNDRYQAYSEFDLVKKGEVPVKGGWRIYSSGPGIYINQVISNVLGIRYQFGNLLLDPVISKNFGQVTINYEIYGKPIKINIHPNEGEFTPKKIVLNNHELTFIVQDNPYRTGAALIKKIDVDNILINLNILDIYL